MIRRSIYSAALALCAAGVMLGSNTAVAQNEAVLADVYGRGVHAFYAGQYQEADQYLTAAIDGGTRDPRAYYFRGLVASYQGRTPEAEADWKLGARLEAQTGGGSYIGRSLSRFQGMARLQLEEIRTRARLSAMTEAAARSDARMRQLGVDPAAPAAPAPVPAPAAPAAAAAGDPFADDGQPLAGGDATVEKTDAMEGLDGNPFKDDAAAGGDASGGAAPAAGGTDPFGGSAPAPAAGGDPFGAPAAPAGDDPFGAPAGGADPFGGDPFGN